MQALHAILLILGSISIIVITVAFVSLVQGILRQVGKVGQVSDDLSHFLKVTEDELVPTTRDARSALGGIDKLVVQITETVERVDNVAAGAERLLDASQVASAATSAVKSSAAGILSVYEGVKQGIKTLRGS